MTRRRRSSGLSDDVRRFQPLRRYFFLPDAKLGCHPAVFWLGAAAIVLIFSFFGFLASRLPFCSPLAMSISLGLVRMQSLIGGWASVAVTGIWQDRSCEHLEHKEQWSDHRWHDTGQVKPRQYKLLHFWMERSLPSVTDQCRGKRDNRRPYADFLAIASVKRHATIAKGDPVPCMATHPGR
jgi:hypothetical protein